MLYKVPVAVEDPRDSLPLPVSNAKIVVFGEKFGHELQPAKWGDSVNLMRSGLILNCNEDFLARELNCIAAEKGRNNYPRSIAKHYHLDWLGVMNTYSPKINFTYESMQVIYAGVRILITPQLRRAFLGLFTEPDQLAVYYHYTGLPILDRMNEALQEKVCSIKNVLRRKN